MAEIIPSKVRYSSGVLYKWASVTENDFCKAVMPDLSLNDKSVMIEGSLGGGSVAMTGTLDPDETSVGNFYYLTDPDGNNIDASAAGIKVIRENVVQYAPGTPSGSSASVDIYLLCTT